MSRASNLETFALAQPVFETLPRSSPVLDGIGTSIPDQLRQARDMGRSESSALQTHSRERRANETYREHNCTGTECSRDEVTIDSSLSHSRDRRWKAAVD